MNARKLARRLLDPLLPRLGIHGGQFWLLVDLFQALADRRELYGQLGREGMALRSVTLIYFLISSVASMLWSLAQPQAGFYQATFLFITGLLLFSLLLAEAGNSLVNATEALVLAHRPIRGATYTAAKLAHLARMVVYLVVGIDGVPALVGLTLPGAGWLYPLGHLGLALALGFACALTCCAIYGWLLRLLPPARVKAVGQVAEVLPFALAIFGPRVIKPARVTALLPADPDLRRWLLLAAGALLTIAVIFGLRSLSADYLLRIASVVQGGRARRGLPRWRWSPIALAAVFGGQPARAAYGYIAPMARRDWQFRRQILPMLVSVIVPLVGMLANLRESPFGPKFSPAHALPHLLGFALFLVCTMLPFGNQPEAAWVFGLAPPTAWKRFARGVHSFLWIWFIGAPHLAVLAGALRFWPLQEALLFTGYSVAMASLYLAVTLSLIEAIPFTRAPQADRSAVMLPVLLIGGVFVAIALGLQYLLVFRYPPVVPAVTIALLAAALGTTRWALSRFAVAMAFSLSQTSGETRFYSEVD